MSVLNRIASFSNRRDEILNQELAQELARSRNAADISEIAENLWNKDVNIQSDCLKVLYELGYLAPELIAEYAGFFIKLLKHPNNRMAWGGMIALSTIAGIKADELFSHSEEIIAVMEKGSVITKDNGIKTLALIASSKAEYNQALFPFLLQHLATCRPKDVTQHAEKTLPAINRDNKAGFIDILEKRMEDLSATEKKRVSKVVKTAQAR